MINSKDTQSNRKNFQIQLKKPDNLSYERVYNDYGEELFAAGQVVPAGTYLEVDGERQVMLDRPGPLPPSFNGRRAYYSRLERPWSGALTTPTAKTSRN